MSGILVRFHSVAETSNTERLGAHVLSLACWEGSNCIEEVSVPQVQCLHNLACYCNCPQTCSVLLLTCGWKVGGVIADSKRRFLS